MHRLKLFLVGLFLFLISITPILYSGTTGKITGIITDKESGESLPGVNVILKETTIGAASDINGNYTILQVPPGVYTCQFSMMGYAKMQVEDIRVRIDQTSRVDIALTLEVIEGETVTIVAEKKVVKEDVATSVTAMSDVEIEELPMSNLGDVVALQAGIENGLEIRGGDASQALFEIDGITLRDPRNNQPITAISLSSIQELSVERGGFNAEYGQVRSGIVNVVTKEGSKKSYHGTVTYKYSPPHAKHFGVSPFDANSMWMRPYLDPAVCWTGTQNGTWDYYTQRQYPTFEGWNKISQNLMTDGNPDNDLSPSAVQKLWKWQRRQTAVTDQPDYNIDAGLGGPVPIIGKKLGNLRFYTSYRKEREMLLIPLVRDDYVDYNWSLQLTSDINESMKLKLSGYTAKSYNVAINVIDNTYFDSEFGIGGVNYWSPTYYMRTPFQIASVTNEQRTGRIFTPSWYCEADVTHYSGAAKLTHMLSPSTFYEASLEFVESDYHTEPGRPRDLTKKYEIVPGYYTDEAPFGWSPAATFGVDGMFFGGHTATVRDYTKTFATTGKFDITSQMNSTNLVKAGAELVYNDLQLKYGEVNNFAGNRNFVDTRKFPIRGALYLQDKFEAKGFIMNIGMRMDYHNANTEWVSLSAFDKSFFSTKYDSTAVYKTEKSSSQISWSPRLGISHPITEKSKLFFNYGHFKQLPSYEEMFRLSRTMSGKISNIGNPELALAKTVSYELGYDHALADNYLLQLAAYYHDIVDQQDYTAYISADASVNYDLATNNSYEDIRGFELTLKKTAGLWWTGFANYTYQVTTSGHFGKLQIYDQQSEQRKYDMLTENLYQDRPLPRPYARASITLHTPAEFGPSLGGLKPLQMWSANVIADWKSGGYATWYDNIIYAVEQNVKLRDYYNLVLRLNKTFTWKKTRYVLFVEVDNLLNTKRLSGASFYDSNDEKDYFNSLHLPKNKAYNNIPGNDKVGDYREDDVKFQPIEAVGTIDGKTNPVEGVFYYEKTTQKYMYYADGNWKDVPENTIKKVLEDKAYINMPNQDSFNFLNPRQIFFGLRMSFDLN
ncbi:MAG TPA: TonB-dependent receptor [bacterium]|nr:TonB-dependent receptor [bacterium]HPN43450.1 TonB-dependent receptor [bacterium]